ncbi:hypothetical protein [Methylobacterium sp. AMS5]|uniref:hypothetical protein n=1 Tax=Methylobacterium sp. AMS5 TaxID=925818 RepID=UPI00074F9F9F|nr:hypothetical protein [Methylobacterium sp. AMS5]AMB45087.1 signal peptide protein [Methylobacterium sp. AMS5]
MLAAAGLFLGAAGPVLAEELIQGPSGAPLPAEPNTPTAPFFRFSDTQVAYTYLNDLRQPGVTGGRAGRSIEGRSAPGNMLSLTHVHGWEYGTNFVNLDLRRYGSQIPAGRPPFPGPATTFDYGQTTLFLTYRGTLSGNALAEQPLFVLPGIIKDVSLAYGVDHQSDDTKLSLLRSRAMGGLSFSFDVPVGFVNIAVMAQKDWFRFADLPPPRRQTGTDVVPRLEATYLIPLKFTGLPLALTGFASYNPPRGDDPKGGRLKAEVLTRANLVLDLGELIDNKPNRVKAFIGVLHQKNLLGANSRVVPGAQFTSFLAGVSFTAF